MLPPGVSVLERGWLSANNVLLEDGDEIAVVDTGYWTHSTQTIALIERALLGRQLVLLLNTHLHSDHCGGNAALQSRFADVRTLIPPGQSQQVREWDPNALSYAPTGQHCPPFRFDGLLCPGDTLRLAARDWEIHAAPGHDPHAVVLFEPRSRVLISADALWRHGFGVVFPELEGEHAFENVARTLDVIEHLRPVVVIPGHGGAFTEVGEALTTARRRLESFIHDPRRHAAHAAKVLIKFKLLEWQCIDEAKFGAWSHGTPYLRLVHERYFGGDELDAWTTSLIAELIRVGAAARANGFILNA